jgi:hypothetical protein
MLRHRQTSIRSLIVAAITSAALVAPAIGSAGTAPVDLRSPDAAMPFHTTPAAPAPVDLRSPDVIDADTPMGIDLRSPDAALPVELPTGCDVAPQAI